MGAEAGEGGEAQYAPRVLYLNPPSASTCAAAAAVVDSRMIDPGSEATPKPLAQYLQVNNHDTELAETPSFPPHPFLSVHPHSLVFGDFHLLIREPNTQLFMFGGYGGSGRLDDFWEFDFGERPCACVHVCESQVT